MKAAEVKITGLSPILMNSFPLEPLSPPLGKRTKEEQAECAAYRDETTNKLYIPGVAVHRALIGGAAFLKGKGRATLQKPAAACLLVTPEILDLGVEEYEIDSRPVVVPATKGRIVRHRPKLKEWGIQFLLEWDPELITAEQARQIVDNTGSRVGLLDFRPACKGPFGRFVVAHWTNA